MVFRLWLHFHYLENFTHILTNVDTPESTFLQKNSKAPQTANQILFVTERPATKGLLDVLQSKENSYEVQVSYARWDNNCFI